MKKLFLMLTIFCTLLFNAAQQQCLFSSFAAGQANLHGSNLNTPYISGNLHAAHSAANQSTLSSAQTFSEKSQTISLQPYAKIEKANVPFYNNPIAKKENMLFFLEMSYFVKLLQEEEGGFYKCEYIDQVGYVLATDLTFVKGVPEKPFANNVSFRVFAFEGLHMRSSPTREHGHFNIVATLPFLESNLTYYGKMSGEVAVPGRSDLWFFAKHTNPISGQEIVGYLYAVFCDNLATIPLNTENLEVIDKPVFYVPNNTDTPSDKFGALPKELQIVIVLGVSLPCLALIYFLFKPTRISLDVGKGKTKKIRPVKNADYYEFED